MARRKRPNSVNPKEKARHGTGVAQSSGGVPGGGQALSGKPGAASAAGFGAREWLFAAALLAAVVLVYQPAWHGGPIWDDDQHITRPELRSWHGLYRIWTEPGATLQYYPVLHTAFWVEHWLWGDAALGYHLVNILLHATAAILVAFILRQLKIPGALLAAAIFALHPVQVESVAWMTEQKNTLSAVFYLIALLVYLKFDESRRKSQYLAALGLFVLAVLSKTVAATLPGALLVIFWWQRGRLSWKRDVLPLVPFFVFGAGAALITVWWELKLNRSTGPEFAFTFVDRLLIAGRTTWFCLAKLFWPTNLIFIYPRWRIDSSVWWQYLFPLSAAALLMVAWAIRRRTRAPLAALLFFGGTLLPTLGFFNLLTFLYSFVADHYQYLASLGIITLVSATATLLFERFAARTAPGEASPPEGKTTGTSGRTMPRPWRRPAGAAACLVLLATLGTLTWRQSRMYANAETLYQTTADRNPECWLAENNLGNVLSDQERLEEAIVHYRRAADLKPDLIEAHINLAISLEHCKRPEEAFDACKKALGLKSLPVGDSIAANVYFSLGNTLVRLGKIKEAIAPYRNAVEAQPEHMMARNNLGVALVRCGKTQEAVALLNEGAWLLATSPHDSIRNGAAAIELAKRAVQFSGGQDPAALNTLAAAYAAVGKFSIAVETATKALDLAIEQKKPELAESIQANIRLFEARTPCRQMP
jgi:protein O-mannosyl-transferase